MLPINHLIRTLRRCCGEYEILCHSSSNTQTFQASILQLATGDECIVSHCLGVWESGGRLGEFLSSRLNGRNRDDAGNPIPSDFDCVPGVE